MTLSWHRCVNHLTIMTTRLHMRWAKSLATLPALAVVGALDLSCATLGTASAILLYDFVEEGHVVFIVFLRFSSLLLFLLLVLFVLLALCRLCCLRPLLCLSCRSRLLRLFFLVTVFSLYQWDRCYDLLLFGWLAIKRVNIHCVAAGDAADSRSDTSRWKWLEFRVDPEQLSSKLLCGHLGSAGFVCLQDRCMLHQSWVGFRLLRLLFWLFKFSLWLLSLLLHIRFCSIYRR